MPEERDLLESSLEHIPESTYGFIFHYYRAEVYRETNWRNRLDTTTNWSIVVTAAILSFAFTNIDSPHSIILVNYFLVWFFLYIESRRFRFYWHLRERTRILEKELLSPIFKGENKIKNNWGVRLAESFKNQRVNMSRLESVAWRFRRNYFFLFPLIILSWIAKVSSNPVTVTNAGDFFYNAKVWFIPGTMVLAILLATIISAIFIAFYIPRRRVHADLP